MAIVEIRLLVLGQQLPRLQLEQRRDEHEELPGGLEVELLPLEQALDERDDDLRDLDVGERELLAQHERQEEVERPLERVEIEIELANRNGAHRAAMLAGRPDRLRVRLVRRPAVAPLRPDETRDTDEEDAERDPEVQAHPEDLLRRIDA